MFQSFPLGDKSSVNLRESIIQKTSLLFDVIARSHGDDTTTNILHEGGDLARTEAEKSVGAQSPGGDGSLEAMNETSKIVISNNKTTHEGHSIDLHALYPQFWGLQAYFSSPTRLFDPQHFEAFKTGLQVTVSTFN